MTINWSDAAIQDLNDIWEYTAQNNLEAATEIVRRIRDTVQKLLADQPGIGRTGRVHGTRELIIKHTSYLLPYRVVGQRLEIIRVYHQARRWPERFD